jgi:hypothetical protein
MEEDIEITLTLEIEEDKNQIIPMLERKSYYDFYTTNKNNRDSSTPINVKKVATKNDLLVCKKILVVGEVSNILKHGKELVDMKIGIKQVVSRHYCTIPKKTNTKKAMIIIFLHALIIFVTIYGLLEVLVPTISQSHKISIAIIPSLIDFAYYSIMHLQKRWKLG